MVGRFLAICGWVGFGVRRAFGAIPLIGRWASPIAAGVAGLLTVAAIVPLGLAAADPQPADGEVARIAAGETLHPDGWIRLMGRIVPLAEAPVSEPGRYGLLVDAADPLEAIVVRGSSVAAEERTTVTGHLAVVPGVALTTPLPIEATVAGTPPRVVGDRVLDLDPAPKPERQVAWLVVAPLAVLAGVLGIGLRAGYPVFRRSREIDVISRPLASGERVPVAVTGRLDERRIPDHAPVEGLVVPARGPRGGILALQLMPPDGRYPPPTPLWAGWTRGRTGHLYTIDERLPAISLRTDRVALVLIFARTAERDRIASQIAVDR